MDFKFSNEQTELQRSVRRFVEKEYKSGSNSKLELWQKLTDLGCLAVPFEQSKGGLGGSVIDLMVILEEFGRGMVNCPLLPVILAGRLLQSSSSESGDAYLSELINGKRIIVPALYESNSRYELQAIDSSIAKERDCFLLNGHKTFVEAGPEADAFLVTAQIGTCYETELGLFIVDTKSEGLSKSFYATQDGRQAAEVAFDKVQLKSDSCLIRGNRLIEVLNQAMNFVLIGLCAEALGAMEVLLNKTIEYCRQREQFGKPLSKQQVIQHRIVDMYLACEHVRSLLYAAACHDAEAKSVANQAIAALKAETAQAGKFVSEQAVQLHGAMGFTAELSLNAYFKRLMVIAATHGDSDHHIRKFIQWADQ